VGVSGCKQAPNEVIADYSGSSDGLRKETVVHGAHIVTSLIAKENGQRVQANGSSDRTKGSCEKANGPYVKAKKPCVNSCRCLKPKATLEAMHELDLHSGSCSMSKGN